MTLQASPCEPTRRAIACEPHGPLTPPTQGTPGPARLGPHGMAWALLAAVGAVTVTTSLSGCGARPAVAPTASVAPAPARSASDALGPRATLTEAQSFEAWVHQFRQEAHAAGITEATLASAFDGVQRRPRLLELDRAQPEFTRPVWDYLDTAVSPSRVTRGHARQAQVAAEAGAAARRYGVPAEVLVAIWGMESNYGSHLGDVPVIDALATLAHQGRREAWAKRELLAALRILQAGDIDRARMVGSWAGAMGHTQFMPSAFLAHAVDADGDGRRDLWNSMADVMASTAQFLSRSGWATQEPCVAEVRLPPSFDLSLTGPTRRQTPATWERAGVRTQDGPPWPAVTETALLLPAGAQGPVFMVGTNFRALLRYNQADSYALAVCLLADQLSGRPSVNAAWPRHLRALTRDEVTRLQIALQGLGFDPGEADGRFGPATRAALQRFQQQSGLPADGFPTADLVDRLTAAVLPGPQATPTTTTPTERP